MTEPLSDQDLLRHFAECRSETAFQTLVQRHADLVFATALRRVNEPGAAQEVTQDVFVALARKAPWLREDASLAGWLYKTTLLLARQWWRGEMRRRGREQTALELNTAMKEDGSLLQSLSGPAGHPAMNPWVLRLGLGEHEAEAPHLQGYNTLFGDEHVLLVKRNDYLYPPRTAHNWNRDNQPHPEAWAPTNQWAVHY